MNRVLRQWLHGGHNFVRLMRPHLYRTFAQLVLGYVLGGGRHLGFLVVVLVVLAPCLYGGLYTLNDVHDYRADRLHPTKRLRPIAAGLVSPRSATAWGLGLIALGLAVAALLDWRLFTLAWLFVLINYLYTWHLKAVPYVEIFANTLTHPLRFWGGLWLAGSGAHALVGLAGLLAGLVVTCLKRLKERRAGALAARPVLRHYTPARLLPAAGLCLAALAALWPATRGWDQWLTLVWLGLAVVAVMVYEGGPALQPHWLAWRARWSVPPVRPLGHRAGGK